MRKVLSTVLDQAKKNHRSRIQDFYLEFVGDLEAKKEKERLEAEERLKLEQMTLEEQRKKQMATDE